MVTKFTTVPRTRSQNDPGLDIGKGLLWLRQRKKATKGQTGNDNNDKKLPISSCKLKVYHEIGPNLYSYDVFLKLRKVTVFFH